VGAQCDVGLRPWEALRRWSDFVGPVDRASTSLAAGGAGRGRVAGNGKHEGANSKHEGENGKHEGMGWDFWRSDTLMSNCPPA